MPTSKKKGFTNIFLGFVGIIAGVICLFQTVEVHADFDKDIPVSYLIFSTEGYIKGKISYYNSEELADYDLILSDYASAHQELFDVFFAEENQIMLVDGFLVEGEKGNTIGCYCSPKKCIKLSVNTSSDYFLDNTLYHELGHFYDSYFGKISESDEWLYLYETYQYTLSRNNDYLASSPSEFFAGCFAEYWTEDESFEEYQPEIDSYIDKLFE